MLHASVCSFCCRWHTKIAYKTFCQSFCVHSRVEGGLPLVWFIEVILVVKISEEVQNTCRLIKPNFDTLNETHQIVSCL